jgi:hypothetical protein
MGDRLVHRGPDTAGTWEDPEAGVALAHRRPSIIDLSPAGPQPMRSADGRWVILLNKADGYLAAAPIASLLKAHLAGCEDAQAPLWHALVFQSWLRTRRAAP